MNNDTLAVQPSLAPVSATERINSVDVIRGFALLGILLMNILSWGLPLATEFNPSIAGGATGPNLAIWFVQMIFWDGKMRALFSMIFGAGIIILTARGEARGAKDTADIYYRRNLWLLAFGLVHAYIIWFGDILYPYALIALILYPFRKLSPKALLIIAGVFFVLLTGGPIGKGHSFREVKEKALAAEAAEKQGKKLTDEEKAVVKQWNDVMKDLKPTPEQVKKDYDAQRGSYLTLLKHRAKIVSRWHGAPIYSPGLWDMLAMMLIGMAFLKMGVLSAERSFGFYGKLLAVGYGIGLPLNAWSAWEMMRHNWEPLDSIMYYATYQPGRLLVALGHMSLLAIICKAGAFPFITRRLAAVGQMAFSNYITHSIVCGFIFYGYGFKLMGQLQRWQLYIVVVCIWIFQLIVSPIWLRHFYFGPLEWCWRSLTYWKKQPMRIRKPELVAEPEAAPPVDLPPVGPPMTEATGD
jgi:uncharacterized protein